MASRPKKDEFPRVDKDALKLADDALRRLLTSPPAPFTPKPPKKGKKKG